MTPEQRAAVEEATQAALKVRDHDVRIAVDNGFKMQADAYEDAAKLVETEHKVCLPLMCETARKIRARAKELK